MYEIDPSDVRPMDYSFAKAHLWKSQINPITKKRFTNADLAKIFGYSNESGFRRRYGRDLDNYEGSVKPPNKPKMLAQTLSNGRKHRSDRIRMGKYNCENNPPTGNVSELDNHDWLTKFDITYTWDRTEERDQVIDWLWSKQGLNVVHRGFGKSKLEWGLVARYIAEVRGSWLEITDGKRSAKKVYKKVKGLLHRKEFRLFYGDIIEQFDGSELNMELDESIHGGEDDPVLHVSTRGGSIVGMHPRVIGIHDFIQLKYKSDESEDDLKDWWDELATFLKTFEIGRKCRISGTITRKGPNDLYSYMFSKGLKFNHMKAIEKLSGRWAESLDDFLFDDDGDPIGLTTEFGTFKTLNCPNWPTYALLYARFTNYHAFEEQMQGVIVPKKGAYFHDEDWKEVDFPVEYYKTQAVEIFVDPGWGMSKAASDTAIAVVCEYRGEFHVMDLAVGKFRTDEIEAQAKRLSDQWEAVSSYFENDYAQFSTRYADDDSIWDIEGAGTFTQSRKGEKSFRIRMLSKPFRLGKIKIHRRCYFKEQLKEQFLTFKGHENKGFDILDVVSSAYQRVMFELGNDIDWSQVGSLYLQPGQQ